MNILKSDPKPISSSHPKCLIDLVFRMISKDARDRPTANQILQIEEMTKKVKNTKLSVKMLQLRKKYPSFYKNNGCIKGKRVDLELEIQEDSHDSIRPRMPLFKST